MSMSPREDVCIKIPRRFYDVFKKYEKSNEAKVFYDHENITVDEYTTWQNYNTENYVSIPKPFDFLTRRRFIFIFFGPKSLVLDVEKTFLESYNKNSIQDFTKYTSKYDSELEKWVPDINDDPKIENFPGSSKREKIDLAIRIYKVVKRKQCTFELYQLSLVIDGLIRNRKMDWLNDVKEFLGVESNIITDSIFHIESCFSSPVLSQFSDEKHNSSDEHSTGRGKLEKNEAEHASCYAGKREHNDNIESKAIPIYKKDFLEKYQGGNVAKMEKKSVSTCARKRINQKRRKRKRSKSSSTSFSGRNSSISKKSRSEEDVPKIERKRRSREAKRKMNSRDSSSSLHVKEKAAEERLVASIQMENFGESVNLSQLDQLISGACTNLRNCNDELLEIYQNNNKLGLCSSDQGGESEGGVKGEEATHINSTIMKLQESACKSSKLLSKTLWDNNFLVAYRMSRRVVFDLQKKNDLLKNTSMNQNLAADVNAQTIKKKTDSNFTDVN